MKTKINVKAFIYLLCFLLVGIVYSILMKGLIIYVGLKSNEIGGFKYQDLKQRAIISFFIAPLLNTIFFQYGVYEFVFFLKKSIQKRNKVLLDRNNNIYIIIYYCLSTGLFAVSHNYSMYYIYLMIFPGFLLSYAFYYFEKNFLYPIFYVFLIQSLHNIFAFIIDNI
ncbi:hypothetical protein CMT84_06360 [Elizabethkingia anophelis]|nr:hypothetical protein [Elizabethkingia anophelis]